MQDITTKVLMELKPNLNAEQLQMVELAVSRALTGCKVEPMETLPACRDAGIPELQEFLFRKEIEGLSKGTLYGYSTFLRQFLYWWNRDLKDFRDMDAIVFLAWYERLKGIGKRTLNNKRVILHTFFRYLHDAGKIPYNPLKTVKKIKYLEKMREPLTDEELEIARQGIRTDRERALFELLYATGCRISEAVSIKVKDIDMEGRAITVIGKGNKQRRVCFNAKAKLAIRAYLASRGTDSPHLFVSERRPHGAVGKSVLEKEIKAIGLRSGLGRDIYPHLLRHTFATDFLNRSGNVADLQTLMGHQKADTTMIYAKISQARIQETHRRVII